MKLWTFETFAQAYAEVAAGAHASEVRAFIEGNHDAHLPSGTSDVGVHILGWAISQSSPVRGLHEADVVKVANAGFEADPARAQHLFRDTLRWGEDQLRGWAELLGPLHAIDPYPQLHSMVPLLEQGALALSAARFESVDATLRTRAKLDALSAPIDRLSCLSVSNLTRPSETLGMVTHGLDAYVELSVFALREEQGCEVRPRDVRAAVRKLLRATTMVWRAHRVSIERGMIYTSGVSLPFPRKSASHEDAVCAFDAWVCAMLRERMGDRGKWQ